MENNQYKFNNSCSFQVLVVIVMCLEKVQKTNELHQVHTYLQKKVILSFRQKLIDQPKLPKYQKVDEPQMCIFQFLTDSFFLSRRISSRLHSFSNITIKFNNRTAVRSTGSHFERGPTNELERLIQWDDRLHTRELIKC